MSHRSRENTRQGAEFAEIADVQDLHATVRSETRGERITIKPFPLWMLVVIGVVFFFTGFFAARDRSDFTGRAAGLDTSPPAPSVRSVQMPTAATGAVQGTITDHNAPVVAHVSIKNMKFNPPNLEVKKGDTVEWRNDDITPHTATSSSFDSGSINPEESWRHTFNNTGSFSYACTFHPDMKAALTVK
jgi:plastocyanin